jgi:alkylated DNA repair dioxygenase AlkB
MEVLRYDRYVPERRLVGTIRRESTPPALAQVGAFLNSRYRARLDGPAALHYRNGEDFQGLHSDREMKWLDETLVALLVLGERRPFVLRRRGARAGERDRVPAGRGPDDITLRPGEGDLVVMGGRCQRDWLHGVPQATTTGPRLSIMWRWTSRRGEPDTMPSYFDGQQFADVPRQRGYRRSR